jgi:hypothetical protein
VKAKRTTLEWLEKATHAKLIALAVALFAGFGAVIGPQLAAWLGDAVSSRTLVRLLATATGALAVALVYIVLLRWRIELETEERKSRRLPSHDRDLFERYATHLGGSVFQFLREQDMGSSFLREQVIPFYVYNDEWKGPQFEFVDQELEESRKVLHGALVAFIYSMLHNTYADGDIVSMGLRDHDTDPKKFEVRDEMNALGHAAADAYENFVRLGRRRISENE